MSVKVAKHLDQKMLLELAQSFTRKSQIIALAKEKRGSEAYRTLFDQFQIEEEYLLSALFLVANDWLDALFDLPQALAQEQLEYISKIDQFYEEIGGIVGYILHCRRLLKEKNSSFCPSMCFPPKAYDLSEINDWVFTHVMCAIDHFDKMIEIYPVGGGADRFNALSTSSDPNAPFQVAATLPFLGKTLLQWLVDDVLAKEFLYQQLYGKLVSIPIVMMTSSEKDGHDQIQKLLEEQSYFGKDKTDIFVMVQPLVPALTPQGELCSFDRGKLLCKPGGHGAIWKLGIKEKIFTKLQKKEKSGLFYAKSTIPSEELTMVFLAF